MESPKRRPRPALAQLRDHLRDIEAMRQCALYSDYGRIKPRCARMFMQARAFKGIPLFDIARESES